METNKKYKDSVFRTIFNEKEKIIELYNQIYQTQLDMSTPIQIITLEDVLYMSRKNDLAFFIQNRFIILMEHQSSINENMPLRFLLYVARLYEKIIENQAIYKRTLLKIPNPEFIVLYNGDQNLCVDRKKVTEKILRLSDAFYETKETVPLELLVRVIDIRYASQHSCIQKPSTLREYSQFIDKIETYRAQRKTISDAVKLAIGNCLEEGILKAFLEQHSTEVFNMLTLEYNEEVAKQVEREEAINEGIQKGKKEVAVSLFDILDLETISKKTGITISELQKLKKN